MLFIGPQKDAEDEELSPLFASTPPNLSRMRIIFVMEPIEQIIHLTFLELVGQPLSSYSFVRNLFEVLTRNSRLRSLSLHSAGEEEDMELGTSVYVPTAFTHLEDVVFSWYPDTLIAQLLSSIILLQTASVTIMHDKSPENISQHIPESPIHIPGFATVTTLSLEYQWTRNIRECTMILLAPPTVEPVLVALSGIGEGDFVMSTMEDAIRLSQINHSIIRSTGKAHDYTPYFWRYVFHAMTSLTQIEFIDLQPQSLVWVLLGNNIFDIDESDSEPMECSDENHPGHTVIHSAKDLDGTLGGLPATVQMVY